MDDTYGNKAWASVAGMRASQVCKIESDFLALIDHRVLYVPYPAIPFLTRARDSVTWEEWTQWTGELEYALRTWIWQTRGVVDLAWEGLLWRCRLWDELDQQRVDAHGVFPEPFPVNYYFNSM